jgi:hypothetical protein
VWQIEGQRPDVPTDMSSFVRNACMRVVRSPCLVAGHVRFCGAEFEKCARSRQLIAVVAPPQMPDMRFGYVLRRYRAINLLTAIRANLKSQKFCLCGALAFPALTLPSLAFPSELHRVIPSSLSRAFLAPCAVISLCNSQMTQLPISVEKCSRGRGIRREMPFRVSDCRKLCSRSLRSRLCPP